MSILSDRDIKKSLNKSSIAIEPFNDKNLTPNGYDLTIEEVYLKKNDQHIKQDHAVIPPMTWFAVSTKEYVKLGSDITAQLWIRTSYARKGIIAAFGKVDAGFEGTLTISCFNANDEPVKIPIDDRFCQINFEKLSSIPSALYEEKSGNYQGQKGVKLNP